MTRTTNDKAFRIERNAWQCLRIRGNDARAWLHRLLSNQVKALRPGQGSWNLLLDDRGRVEAIGFVLCESEHEFALWAEAGERATWLGKLEFFLFAEDVSLISDDGCTVIELMGTGVPHILERVTARELPTTRGDHIALEIEGLSFRYVCEGRGPNSMHWLVVDHAQRTALVALLENAHIPATTTEQLYLERIRMGIASFHADLSDGVRPAEGGLEFAFDLDKGCYPGQETVARMDTYGGPQRKLFLIECPAGTPLPVPGTKIREGDVEIGRTGSFAIDAPAQRVLGLALIAKKAWQADRAVTLESGAQGRLRALPFEA